MTTARWVVGADGAVGVTRRATLMRGGRTGRLMEGIFEAEHSGWDSRWMHFSFEPVFDDIPGYAWIFPYPTGDNRSLWKIGVMDGQGRVGGARLRQWVMGFAAEQGFRLAEGRLVGWPEHYYAVRNRAHRPGLVLVGEAHGIDALLGEGIAPSLEMASFAAEKIKAALDKARRSIPFFELQFANTESGRNLIFQNFLAARIYGPNGPHWLQRIFESEKIRTHGALGKASYGRLLRRAPDLVSAVLNTAKP